MYTRIRIEYIDEVLVAIVLEKIGLAGLVNCENAIPYEYHDRLNLFFFKLNYFDYVCEYAYTEREIYSPSAVI